jgi:predicted PurR-regulated permease PerM
MTEPQVWTMIGVMVAALVAILTIVAQSFQRSIAALGDRMDAKFETVNARFDGLHAEMMLRFDLVDRRFEQVDQRFERLEKQVSDLDRDVQAISKRVFPE